MKTLNYGRENGNKFLNFITSVENINCCGRRWQRGGKEMYSGLLELSN